MEGLVQLVKFFRQMEQLHIGLLLAVVAVVFHVSYRLLTALRLQ
jgi:chromate transport protein ChrA